MKFESITSVKMILAEIELPQIGFNLTHIVHQFQHLSQFIQSILKNRISLPFTNNLINPLWT